MKYLRLFSALLAHSHAQSYARACAHIHKLYTRVRACVMRTMNEYIYIYLREKIWNRLSFFLEYRCDFILIFSGIPILYLRVNHHDEYSRQILLAIRLHCGLRYNHFTTRLLIINYSQSHFIQFN